MSKRRKTYTKSEKLEIVKLSLEDNESIKSLATRFEISEQSIYNWRRLFLEHEDAAFPGRGNKTLNESDRKIEEL